ncbi:MAG: hypothetical protein IOC55_06005 [Methylobacterium sp.]|nr:hypothetical protein [Methylobacterium sp.]
MSEEKPKAIAKEERESDEIVWRAQLVSVAWLLVMVGLVAWQFEKAKEISLPNWGDFFAGFFAPLAFLWLVVAVFIQRNELRAQIKELSASRVALETQIKEQKQTAQALTNQSSLMREEWEKNKNLLLRQEYILFICDEIKKFYSDKDVYFISFKYHAGGTANNHNLVFYHDYHKIVSESDLITFLRSVKDTYKSTHEMLSYSEIQIFEDPAGKSIEIIRSIKDFYINLSTISETISMPSIVTHLNKIIEILQICESDLNIRFSDKIA